MYDIEKPFHRLIHHFITRTFHGSGEGDELRYGIPALLGILSTPSAFGAIALMHKYSSIQLLMMRRSGYVVDVYRASVSDEYFFIVYSMVITGAIVILKWDSLFPDRQDYDNFAVLPISARQILLASLVAMLLLAVIFAIDINLAACVIFPFAVTMEYDTLAAYIEFFLAHGSAVLLSSIFTCFALLSVLGMTMLAVPRRYLRGASLIVRIMGAFALAATLGSAFNIPKLLLTEHAPRWLGYVPSVWFLDLHQALLARGAIGLTGTANLAVEVTVMVFFLAFVLYGITYSRHFMSIPEHAGIHNPSTRDEYSILRRIIDTTVLRTPFQRATYHFGLKTLFRSERHGLLFGGACSIGFFLAAQEISLAIARPARFAIDPQLLAPPLILSYCVIVSLRVLFDQPADRRANWIFRLLVEPRVIEPRQVATKVMMATIIPWLVLIGFPLYIATFGWQIAILHICYVLLCAAGLAAILLGRFRKIPFTCLHIASKDRVLAMVIICMVGLSIFGTANSRLESWLLEQPVRMIFVLPIFIVIFYGLHIWEGQMTVAERSLIFQDRPAVMLQTLELSKPK